MRAKYLLNAAGDWKGVNLTPFCEFDVPPHLEEVVARNANFAVLPAPEKRKRRSQDADEA